MDQKLADLSTNDVTADLNWEQISTELGNHFETVLTAQQCRNIWRQLAYRDRIPRPLDYTSDDEVLVEQ